MDDTEFFSDPWAATDNNTADFSGTVNVGEPTMQDISVDPSLTQPGNISYDPGMSAGGTGWQQVLQQVLAGRGGQQPNNTTAGIASMGSGIIGLIQAYNLNKASQSAMSGANPFGGYRAQYGAQLSNLMQNPSAIFNDPGYKAAFDQGTTAVERAMAAKGMLGSGNEAIALQQFGQSFGLNYLTQQEQFLAQLAGANINPNYAPSLGGMEAATGITSSALGSLGYGLTRFGGASAGTPAAASAGGFSSAGGEAATAIGEAKLAGSIAGNVSNWTTGGSPAWLQGANKGIGMASNAMGIYSGIERGGPIGYAQAGANAVKLADSFGLGSGVLDTAAGYVGPAIAAYNFVDNWQSGDTGGDAARGAEAGASIGTMIVPGIGTVVGGLIGGAVGAVSSAFGGGKPDPETENWNKLAPKLAQNPSLANQLSPAQNFQLLAGVMDAKNNTPGHSTNLELIFGRMGENKLMTQMSQQINAAISSGAISPNASPADIYSQVVTPWLKQIGAYVPEDAIISSSGQRNNGSIDAVLTGLIGNWQSGALGSGTPVGVSGQNISGLPGYARSSSPTSPLSAITSAATAQLATGFGGPNVRTPTLQLRALGA